MMQSFAIGAIGLFVLILGAFKLRKVRASRSWPQAAGTVVESSVREDLSQGDDETPDSWSYTPVIRYRFEVGGQTWEGDRIGFDRKAYSKKKAAMAVVARYPVDSPVRVFFNPVKPTDCALETASGSAWILVAAGAAVMLFALAAAIRS